MKIKEMESKIAMVANSSNRINVRAFINWSSSICIALPFLNTENLSVHWMQIHPSVFLWHVHQNYLVGFPHQILCFIQRLMVCIILFRSENVFRVRQNPPFFGVSIFFISHLGEQMKLIVLNIVSSNSCNRILGRVFKHMYVERRIPQTNLLNLKNQLKLFVCFEIDSIYLRDSCTSLLSFFKFFILFFFW